MITYTIQYRKNTKLELEVNGLISLLPYYCEDLAGAKRVFDRDISLLKSKNNFRPEDMFKSEIKDGRLEVWKMKPDGDKEKLKAIVRDDGKEKPQWMRDY